MPHHLLDRVFLRPMRAIAPGGGSAPAGSPLWIWADGTGHVWADGSDAVWPDGGPDITPEIIGVPTISGDTGLGDTLTASAATVASYPEPATTWQWYRDGSPISGATNSTYTIVEADQGTDIRVRQTSTNSEGSDTATSDATAIPSGAVEADAYRIRETGTSGEEDFTLTEKGDGTLAAFTGVNDGACPTWYDISGNGNHAAQTTALNQPLLVVGGVVQEGVKFDGANDFLSTSGRITTGSVAKLFVSLWVKASSPASNPILCAEYNVDSDQRSWAIQVVSATRVIRIIVNDTGVSGGNEVVGDASSTDVADGTWHHVAFYFNAGAVKIFIDGSETTSVSTGTASIYNGSSPFYIGGHTPSGLLDNPFTGELSDIRIAEGAAADDHVTNVADIMAGTYEGSPVAHYPGAIPAP